MSSLIEPRPPQTKVKHTILKEYLKAWGGIILNGLKGAAWKNVQQGKPFSVQFIFVDCHASAGRYAGELEQQAKGENSTTVFGSSVIGIEVLDALLPMAKDYFIDLTVNTVLLEEKAGKFEELKRSLDLAGLTSRVVETDQFHQLKPGQIAIWRCDSKTVLPQLKRYTQGQGYKFAFYLFDPYGPKAIPLSFVSSIIQAPRHDAIIYMPYHDLHKKSGLVDSPDDTYARDSLLKNYDQMFGHDQWHDIVRQLDLDALLNDQNTQTQSRAKRLENSLVTCYKDALRSADPELTVKFIGMRFASKERSLYYLYLTTHDATGALKMNEVIYDAGYQEHELRWQLKEAQAHGPQLSMLDNPVPAKADTERPSVDAIADDIFTLLTGQCLTRKTVYAKLADKVFFPDEVDKALRLLRRKKKADFTGNLSHKTVIDFK